MTCQSIWSVRMRPPDAAVQAGEDERREVPDVRLRAQFAQPAAGEAAADGEGERAELAGEERGQPAHHADEGAGVGAGDEAGQERGLRASGRPPRSSAAGAAATTPAVDGDAEAEGEDQPVGPGPAFGQQDRPEPVVAHEDDGDQRD